jgi:hypothetical protein
MPDSVLSELDSKRCSASAHSSVSGLSLSRRVAITRARCVRTGRPLPDDCRNISPIVLGSSGVSSNSRPRPMNRLRAWSLKKASDEVPLPSFG